VAWVKSLWPEHEHYLDVYHHYRLTGERSVFAHGIHLRTPSGSACTRPVQRWPSARPQPVSRQRAVSFTGLLAAQGADGHRQRCRRGHHLQYAAHLGEAYKVSQLQSYRLRASEAFYHATLGGARACA
jgi:guanine deaminase